MRAAFLRMISRNASEATWVDLAVYDEGAGPPVSLADFEGRPAFMAVDLASVQDLAALFLAARDGDGWIVWCRQYCPEAQIRKRADAGLPYPEIERAILSRKFRHGGNALLRWNFSNVRPETDAAGNLKFSKARSAEKIDGAVAAAMAIGVALTTRSRR